MYKRTTKSREDKREKVYNLLVFHFHLSDRVDIQCKAVKPFLFNINSICFNDYVKSSPSFLFHHVRLLLNEVYGG